MLRFVLYVFLLAMTAAGSFAEPQRVIRTPVAEFVAEESKEPEHRSFKTKLSRDGALVAYVRRDGKVTVYSVKDAKLLFTSESTDLGTLPYTSDVVFSADGKLLALPRKPQQIELLSATTGRRHASFALRSEEDPSSVVALAFSPDGQKLAVSSGVLYHMDLHVFDTATGKLLGQPLKGVDCAAWQLMFSANGKRLIANHGCEIYVVDTATYQVTAKISEAGASYVFFRDEKLYAVQGESRAIYEVTDEGLANAPMGRFAEETESNLPRSLRLTAIAGYAPVAAISRMNQVSVRSAEGRELFRVAGEDSPIKEVRLSLDGRTLLIYRESTRIEVFRLE